MVCIIPNFFSYSFYYFRMSFYFFKFFVCIILLFGQSLKVFLYPYLVYD